MKTPILAKVIKQLESLPEHLQRQVLEYAESLGTSAQGVPGGRLLRFAGSIPAEDLSSMQEAIENGCEQVDPNEW